MRYFLFSIIFEILKFTASVAQIESNDTFISSFSNIYSVGFASLLQHFENIFFLAASDHLLLDLLAESSMNLRKLIDLDRELVSSFSEFHGWALKDDGFGFDDLG